MPISPSGYQHCSAGLKNVLALRGDVNPNVPAKDDFKYASELVSFIKGQGDFHVSGACYPEVHLEAPDEDADEVGVESCQSL